MSSEGESPNGPPHGAERRANPELRRRVQELLLLIRELYKTCHMVAVGQLEPSRAKATARVLEEKLQAMMNEMLEGLEADATHEEGEDPS